MSSLYDVEVDMRRNPYPYRSTGLTAERAQEVAEGCLAAWGKPFPRDFADGTFVGLLAQHGAYRFEIDEYRITVKPTTKPN